MALTRHLDDLEISQYADALQLEKFDRLPAEVLEHVADCAACKQEVLQLYRILKRHDLEEQAPGGTPDQVTPEAAARPSRLWYRLAAGLAVLLGGGLLWYLVEGRVGRDGQLTGEQKGDSVAVDSSAKSTPGIRNRGAYAANFVPSPNLEDLAHTTFRTGAARAVTGAGASTTGGTTLFRWHGEGGDTYTLRVLDNRENEKKRVEVSGTEYLLQEALQPGLYYWLLQENGELVHVGKFTIE